MKTMYDNVSLVQPEPNTDIVAFYIGGDTPHVWTAQEISGSKCRYRLPIYVRSFSGVDPIADANAAINHLTAIAAPKGTTTALDLETLIDPPFVSAYGAAVRAAGYKVISYGSLSYVRQNPILDGYWVADWDNVAGWDADDPSDVVAIQYQSFNAYDLSVVADTVILWDSKGVNTMPTITSRGTLPEKIVDTSCSRDHTTGQLDVFYVGVSGVVYHEWFLPSVGWNGPENMSNAG